MAQVRDKRYSNWVKDTLSLLYVKEGLEVFIDSQSAAFHAQLTATFGSSACTCNSSSLGRGKTGWVVKQCYGVCQSWLDRIIFHHRLKPPSIPNIFPGNVNAQLWPTDYWEVMKCFQPQGCQDQHSASDADIAALLDLMRNCDHFFQFYNTSNNLVKEVMGVRNRLMHSSNFHVEDSDLVDDVQKMMTFLRSMTALSADESQAVQEAIDKITKLRSSKMEISLDREDELRVLNTKLQVLVNAVDALKTTVGDLSSSAQDTNTEVASNAGDVDKLKAQHQQMNTDLINTRKELAEVKSQSSAFNQFLTDYKIKGVSAEKLSEVTDQIARLETDMQEQMKELPDRMEKLELHYENMSKTQDELEKNQGEMKRKHEQMKKEQGGLKGAKVKLERQHKMMTRAQGQMKREQEQMKKEQGGLKKAQGQIKQEQGGLKKAQGQIKQEQGALKKTQGQMKQEQGGLKKAQGQFRKEQKGMKRAQGRSEKQHKITTRAQKQMQREQGQMKKQQVGLKKAQGQIQREHDGLKRTQGKLEMEQKGMKREQRDMKKDQQGMKRTLEEVSEEQRQSKRMALDSQQVNIKDIQDRLIGLYSQTRLKIPIYPLQPELTQHVASLFVLPSMKLTNPRGISEHHIMGADEGSESTVTRLHDIFAPAGSRCTDIYIMGDAGTGKSTLCEYLVHLWVSCHSSSNQVPDSEASIMKQFDLLFYISLREAGSCNVDEMIKSQLQLEDVNVASLLYNHSSLIILDGLDEYSLKQPSKSRISSENLPARRYSNKCTVLTTSRPWKIELLRKELDDKVERLIAIVGLDTKSQKKLVDYVVGLLSTEKNHVKNPADFIKQVKTQKLDTFMKTPIILMQMLGLWLSGEPLGGSKCSIYAKLIDKQIQFTEEVRGYPTDPQLQSTASDIGEVQLDDESTCSYQHQFSTFFKNYKHIMNNKDLVLKLCRFAYCSLSREDKTHSMVFNHEQMELSDMSHEDIRLCLHLGILTQYKVFGQITQRLKYISFIHKSHHEFCAAIYLSQIDQAELKQLLEQDFTSLGHILEMGTVFMFVCGISPKVACNISRFIMDKASGDARLEQYQQVGVDWYNNTDPISALVKQLQGLILAGIEEGRQNGHEITDMQLHDLYMDVMNTDFPPARVLACTGSLDLTHVKSLFIRDKCVISGTVLQELLQQTLKSLHKLVLIDTAVSVKMIQSSVQQQQGRLQTLGLLNYNVDNVDVSHLNQTDLQVILSAPTKSLSLHGLDLTHSQLQFLCQHVSNSSYWGVCLGKLHCTTHENKGCEYKHRLDLSANRNINRLRLVQLQVQEVLFVPENLVRCMIGNLPQPVITSMINCLKRAGKLKILFCYCLRGSTVDELATTLPHLQQLQNLALGDINLSGQQRVVRAVAKLKKLELLQLYSVTMREEELREMLSALPSSHRVLVVLGGFSGSASVTITGYNKHTNILEQIRRDPNTHVSYDEVKIEGDTCIVKWFGFYTKK